MPLNKQSVNINFSSGIDSKTDPYQVSVGKFLALENTIFTKGGLLQKRNGYAPLAPLPDQSFTTLTTFNGDLTAIGNRLFALSEGYSQWVNRGKVQPLELSTLTLIRNNVSQSQSDTAISDSGLICTVYSTQNPANLANTIYMYVVADANTGQNIVSPTLLPTGNITVGGPRVFLLDNYFVIVFNTIVGVVNNLKFIALSTNNPNLTFPLTTISTDYVPSIGGSTTFAFDGIVSHHYLYVAWNSSTGIRLSRMDTNFVPTQIVIDPANNANIFSFTSDEPNNTIWLSYYNSATQLGYTLSVNIQANIVVSVTNILSSIPVSNLTSLSTNNVLTIFYEVAINYSYTPQVGIIGPVPSHFIETNTITRQATVGLPGTLGVPKIIVRSVGLASKAFIIDGLYYMLTVYSSLYQSTYFLINGLGNVVAILAYSNARGYITTALPSVNVQGNLARVSYLIKDLVQSVNKNTNIPAGNQVAGVYSQIGINLASFTFNISDIITAEIGNNLNITGGITWAYDGYSSVEQEFFLYPDNVAAVYSPILGSLEFPATYFYQVTYEWTDNQGNAFKSAPSIPVSVPITLATSSISLNIPTLRLTYKVDNPVKIVIYRWSTNQQSYYQVTSIITPIINDPTVDSITFLDTLSDTKILGNNLLYTTGGVLENIGPPSFKSIFIFDDRLWGITSEDNNLLWFSKQVLSATPVEFTDLQTLYVAPNIGAQGPTGSLTCGASMDDKLILFKSSAINYIGGSGPDATGANNQYTQPIFITATVGCSNQHSIVFQPQGLMFEFSSKAGNQIWLLSRELGTQYIGAPVEKFTLTAHVKSAVNIPGTNQIRFTMDTGITLMYDYYYQQWGTFVKVPAISSTLYQGVHAFLNTFGQVLQETPGVYLDGSNPVLVSFTTSWLNLAGLKGYMRTYRFYLLGTYITPHLLNLQIAYDYNPNSIQYTTIAPTNFNPAYGNDLTYGSGTPYGGVGVLEQWRVFLTNQRCESFQITLKEQYDPRFGIPAGAGLTLSGINCVVGIKGSFIPMRADQSIG